MHAADGAVPSLTLGWRMKMALEHAGVSSGDMADYLEVSRHTITRWTGDKGPVKRSTLRLWSMRTGVSMSWLETGQAILPDDGEEGQGYAIRDSNPEPADLVDSLLALAVVA